ncbi:hypothetical protein B296_00008253 [Ensete ventricosum]|uniref:Uncharacterized protein n=1 Tax=Ensete ventricosum TaxID=4639 RepID=A0A426XYU1_ENSVE|nr:hypothetical protein B296_00008253 [Ensete ventricosum]
MASTPSFSISSFSSSLSSPIPPSREERRRSNDSSGNQSVPESSSSGVMMTGAEAKVLQALEHELDAWKSPGQGGRPRTAPSISTPAPPPPSIPPIESGSASDVQEILVKEAKGAPEASRKRRGAIQPARRRKTDADPLTRPTEPQREKGPLTPRSSLQPQDKGPSR